MRDKLAAMATWAMVTLCACAMSRSRFSSGSSSASASGWKSGLAVPEIRHLRAVEVECARKECPWRWSYRS